MHFLNALAENNSLLYVWERNGYFVHKLKVITILLFTLFLRPVYIMLGVFIPYLEVIQAVFHMLLLTRHNV